MTDEQIDAILIAADPAYRAVSPEHAPAWRRKARIIYAAAMLDAAGVAREHEQAAIGHATVSGVEIADSIAERLETIAKEASEP